MFIQFSLYISGHETDIIVNETASVFKLVKAQKWLFHMNVSGDTDISYWYIGN